MVRTLALYALKYIYAYSSIFHSVMGSKQTWYNIHLIISYNIAHTHSPHMASSYSSRRGRLCLFLPFHSLLSLLSPLSSQLILSLSLFLCLCTFPFACLLIFSMHIHILHTPFMLIYMLCWQAHFAGRSGAGQNSGGGSDTCPSPLDGGEALSSLPAWVRCFLFRVSPSMLFYFSCLSFVPCLVACLCVPSGYCGNHRQ